MLYIWVSRTIRPAGIIGSGITLCAIFFKYGTSVFPAIVYAEEDVRKLAEYKDSKVDYYTTLKVYIENNMNLLHTAEKLFIHRTTLFHRLKHIEKIISADLTDSESRFRLLLSFKLMEVDSENYPEKIYN